MSFSRIQTLLTVVDGKQTDHLTTTSLTDLTFESDRIRTIFVDRERNDEDDGVQKCFSD